MAGVCYGMLGNNLPPPNEAVDLFQRNNIRRIRIYAPNDAVIQALKGTNIELMMDVPNHELQRIASDNLTAAYDWVYYYIVNNRADVKFKYIVVGNEVSMDDWRYVLPAMKNIYSAVQSAGLQDQIKVSTAIYSANLSDSYPPSRSVFRGDLLQYLQPIVGFLVEKRAPLFCNLYPYISYLENPRDIRLDYALFTAPSVLVWDGQYGYQNLFDALLDCVYAALEKVGGSSVEVVVSESGWPNAGDFASTTENAQTYLNKLIQHVKGGTPRRPGRPIETYIFAMFDENTKTGPEREKHFGLFTPYKQPKYNINFY
ncbi:PREDICTED: glucan endo-1,3-beta-glucosidase, basic vacuolar isoform-like [Nelumbo nucifera]|uniref:Glucan endo-1,3-beta-glucosidase, basic vacuolar isoform-like n=1 Tax=Nelumbo nucifera TaxID=4432 RepID=A0A1U8BQL6_NELNU|nr:PREDICTED: glucan endo-1,3-beta-glucosidase, basic vacuolar isoform-like [Nelumbo nucifera]